MMRTVVITAGSVEKRDQVPEPARAEDLADPYLRRRVEERLAPFACPAAAMYASAHHRQVVAGVAAIHDRWGPQMVRLAILSPGYGLLGAEEVIVPYEATFDDLDAAGLAQWAARLRIHERVTNLVREADLVFYLLRGRALSVLGLPLDVPAAVQQIVLTDEDSLAEIPRLPNLWSFVAAECTAARRWHVKAPQVNGFLFGRLCEQVVRHGPAVLEWLYRQPQDVDLLFYKRARWRPQYPLL